MTDQKAHLKAMINHMIEKNNEAAAVEFHSYLAQKMQNSLEKMNADTTTRDTTDDRIHGAGA